MKYQFMISMMLVMAILPSCYTAANIRKIETNTLQDNRSIVYNYQIGGLQQMLVYIAPGRGIIYDRYDRFSQEQLSNIRVSIKSLNGNISVNGFITVKNGETRKVNLRKGIIGRHGSENPEIGDIGKYVPVIRAVSVEKSIHLRKLDFILIVEDLNGFTRDKGIRVSGGFQDSL